MTSLPDKVKSRIRKLFENRRVRRILLGFLLTLSIISMGVISTLGKPQPGIVILVMTTVILLYLEVLETEVLRFDDYFSRPTIISNHAGTDDDEAPDERVRRRIKEFRPRSIHLLDLSGKNAERILETTASNNVETYLLIKIPQTANTTTQYKQIRTFLTETLPVHRRRHGTDHLHIRLYPQDSVVRGRLVGKRYLLLSWYIRVFDSPSSEGNQSNLEEVVPDPAEIFDAIRSGQNREQQKLWGHNVVHVEFSRENDGFEELKEDFFKDRLYKNLWASGITPKQLYDRERSISEDEPVYEDGSLDEDDEVRPFRFGRPLVNWVDNESVDEEKREERRELLEEIGDSTTNPESLFETSLLPKL